MRPIYAAVTIDTESPQTPLFEKRFCDNRFWGDPGGLEEICAVLEEFGVVGTFFVNVCEYTVWGREEMAKVVRFLHERGHCVGLHTHPIWVDEKRRENMFQLPLPEQRAILRWGADFIESCSGRRPRLHRAGAYGINADTLEALSLEGFAADCSNFSTHHFCRARLPENMPVTVGDLLVLPVTFCRKGSQCVKTDLDWIDPGDLEQYLNALADHEKINYIDYSLHSYSLTATADQFATAHPSADKAATLRRVLGMLRDNPDVQFVTPDMLTQAPDVQATREMPAPQSRSAPMAQTPEPKPVPQNQPSPASHASAFHHSVSLGDLMAQMAGEGDAA
ncbi:MAG: polysaccharide deacetylase family protein [Phycisphaerae bacterium]